MNNYFDELKTLQELEREMKAKRLKRKYREILFMLMNNTIPSLDELCTYVCSERFDKSISKGLFTWVDKIKGDLQNLIIDQVST